MISSSLSISHRSDLPFEEGLVRALSLDLQSRSLESLADALGSRDYDRAVSLPGAALCTSPAYYFAENLGHTLLKKHVGLETSFDRVAAAKSKWLAGESSCRETNLRLHRFVGGLSQGTDSEWRIHDFIREIRKEVSLLLGPVPSLDSLPAGFGPGATYGDRGNKTTIPDKMSSAPTQTSQLGLLGCLALANTLWARCLGSNVEIEIVQGNRYTTAPKTAKTDRSIAVEPSLNMFLQLGFGREIRASLRRHGWDLSKAQGIHREMARVSSIDRSFCTIDLENASDTVSKLLVQLLLPKGWHELLNRVRSHYTVFPDGHSVHLQKFSSMGNGFTFELETLLFAAISCCTVRRLGYRGFLGKDVFVYGDDIIVPDECFKLLSGVLRFFGFSINNEKSFHGDTPFRESCGGDYLNGVDVRGCYLKDTPREPTEYISLHNQLFAAQKRLEAFCFLDLRRALDYVSGWLPSRLRKYGPERLGDGVLHSEDTDQWHLTRRQNRILIRTVHRTPRFLAWGHWKPAVQLAAATLFVGDGRRGVIPRNPPSSIELQWTELARLGF